MEKEKGENSSWKKYGEGTGAKYLKKNIWLTEGGFLNLFGKKRSLSNTAMWANS